MSFLKYNSDPSPDEIYNIALDVGCSQRTVYRALNRLYKRETEMSGYVKKIAYLESKVSKWKERACLLYEYSMKLASKTLDQHHILLHPTPTERKGIDKISNMIKKEYNERYMKIKKLKRG